MNDRDVARQSNEVALFGLVVLAIVAGLLVAFLFLLTKGLFG